MTRAIVTGAASGIGEAISRRLAYPPVGPPSELLLVDRDAARLHDLAASLTDDGVSAHTEVVDLSRPDAGEVVAAVARAKLGGVDTLYCSAGIAPASDLATLGAEDFDLVIAINTRSLLLLATALLPELEESRGSIVFISSVSAEEPTAGLGAYSASKAAAVMLIRQLAYEWGPRGIRCNSVAPGAIHTPLTAPGYAVPGAVERREQRIPLRRIGEPDAVARVAVFLASPDADYITGVNLPVDGGMLTTLMPHTRL
jgi:NAD(P)-dependent dehydrogenase (short-subunit alcohol dehydrogenase family)